jgi:hypothetical protein
VGNDADVAEVVDVLRHGSKRVWAIKVFIVGSLAAEVKSLIVVIISVV